MKTAKKNIETRSAKAQDTMRRILVFGGTTEGRAVAGLLDDLQLPYDYSSKTSIESHGKGRCISGAMNQIQMLDYCRTHQITLIIDAAHPFATELHHTILAVAQSEELPCIRFERKYPDVEKNTDNIRYFESYEALQKAVVSSEIKNILALTGVQTISKLPQLWQQRICFFRILETESSMNIAKRSGIDPRFLIQRHPKASVHEMVEMIDMSKAELMLSKESGASGYIQQKLDACEQRNIPLWMVRRPQLHGYTHTVEDIWQLHALMLRLRRSLIDTKGGMLRSGFTSGSCVTASAKAALVYLLSKHQLAHVEITIPAGDQVRYRTYLNVRNENNASFFVIKDGGDDPDITHGERIGCKVTLVKGSGIQFLGGEGIGRVTMRGLQIDVGEPAINPTPRAMIRAEVDALCETFDYDGGILIEPYVVGGAELAKQTFNERVGIVGGLSILGTSGRVEPFSNRAFLESMSRQMDVAKAAHCRRIILTSGLRSENRLKQRMIIDDQRAYIHFGNLVEETIRMAYKHGFRYIVVGLMFGKAIKLAEGHGDTHSKKVCFHPRFAQTIAQDCGYSSEIVQALAQLKIANAISDHIPANIDEPFYRTIAQCCQNQCAKYIDSDCTIQFELLFQGD